MPATHTPASVAHPLDTVDDATLQRWTDRAWKGAARSWSEYWTAVRDNAPLSTTNALNESAWADENYWRDLYDACKARGIAPAFAR